MSDVAAYKAAHDAVLDEAWAEMMRVCPPLHHPPKPTLPTRILPLIAHARKIGTPLLPHQICILATITEAEAPNKPKRYSETLVMMGRQSGKSALLIALTTERIMNADNLRVLWGAQALDSAKEQFRQSCWKTLVDAGMVEDYGLKLRADATPQISCESTRGTLFLRSSNAPKSIRGQHFHMLVIDEVFDILDDECESAFYPTLSVTEKTGASTVLASTAPLEHSMYLEKKMVIHKEEANKEGSDLAFWFWGATEEDDCTDPEVWKRVLPGLSFGLTTEKFVAGQFKKLELDKFKREYLTLREVTKKAQSLVVVDAWEAVEYPQSSKTQVNPPIWFGIDAAPDGSIAHIVAADASGVIELVEYNNGIDWVPHYVEQHWAEGNIAGVALLVPGPLSNYEARLVSVGENHRIREAGTGKLVNPIMKLSQSQFAVASQNLRSNVLDSSIHVVFSDGKFVSALRQSRKRPLGTSGAFTIARKNDSSDCSALVAASLALYATQNDAWAETKAEATETQFIDSFREWVDIVAEDGIDWADDDSY